MISFLRNAAGKGGKLGTTEYSSLLFSPLCLTPVDSFVFGVIQEVILDFPVASKLPNHRVWILCLTGPLVPQPRWWHLRSGPHTSPFHRGAPILPSFRLGYHRHSQMGSALESDTPLPHSPQSLVFIPPSPSVAGLSSHPSHTGCVSVQQDVSCSLTMLSL